MIIARVRESQWAGEFETGQDAEDIDRMMQFLGDIGSHLGEETTLSILKSSEGSPGVDGSGLHPLVMAEVTSEGLTEAVDNALNEIKAHVEQAEGEADLSVAIVSSPTDAQPRTLSVWISDDLLVATTSPEALADVAGFVAGAANPFVESEFYASLRESYVEGVELLGGANFADGLGEVASGKELEEMTMLGVGNVSHAIVDRRQADDLSTLSGTVHFSGRAGRHCGDSR